ncbi:Nse4 C-terminal-domain-containing protein [Syncephalis pseudoplumigaleata]|uniref:Non-structural maintenance of chromosomes element 4 n=1 Tax=Syncephalis pseudoplumigaleata TaxID=1712513 RepID=A0A4P9YY22_9FUNG|nr:Nse4 C-terminal-domain-containing protein [Syncephalis pseudoplumigaleata]|eukprot:RKP24977.1 Nse4 C-terminal-domain-containing protein [Syncephalis pseudoplumigaleata]
MDLHAKDAFSQQLDRITNRNVYDPDQPEAEKRFLRQEYRQLIESTEIKQPYEATLDSRLLVLSADINHEKARRMRVEHGLFDVDEFISRLVTVMGGRHDLEASRSVASEQLRHMDWTRVGRLSTGYMARAPAGDFILGPLSLTPKEYTRQRTTNKAVDRSAVAARPVEMQGNEIVRDENETTKNVIAIASLLEKVGPINLFRFIINPDSFGQTVENLFHLSFLIRDGKASIDDETDEPILELCMPPTNENYQQGLTKKQLVMELDPVTWKELIELYDITSAIIPSRDTSDAS